MPTNLPKVMTYLTPEDKEELKEWAEEDTRSMAAQARWIIEQALKERRRQKNKQEKK